MLLEHNIETYKQLCDTMDNYGHAVVIQTTGSGKSFITLEYIEDNQFNTLVVVPSHIIGKQWSDKSELITYVCYDTFVKFKDFYEYDLVIFDEAHHLGAPTYEKAFKSFIELGIPYIGLTADSVRWSDSARDIAYDYFTDSTIRGLSLRDGIESGILPSIEYTVAIYSVSQFISEYLKDKKISESLVARLNYTINNTESINNIIKKKADISGMKGVLFVDSIDRVPFACSLLRNIFGDCIDVFSIHSGHSDSHNLKQVELFKNSSKAFVVAVNMLNEGLHVDDVNTIIMLRRTISPNVYFQQIGRGISVGQSRRLQVFDLVGNKNLLRVMSRKGTHKTLIHESIEHIKSDQFIIDDRTVDIMSVLNDISDSLSDSWKPWEDEKLRSEYPSKGTNIPELLDNGRTEKAIKARAQKLGIRNETINYWQPWEDEKLRSEYPSKGTNIPELLENGRTAFAIMARARELNIKYIANSWEAWEYEKIKSNYPSKGPHIPELLENGRSESAIISKANKLGIKYIGNKWQSWEDEKIKSDYPSKGPNIPELLKNGRTIKNIANRAKRLGVKKLKGMWQIWEDEKIKSDYPDKGSNIPELLENGRSVNNIRCRAKFLGVKRLYTKNSLGVKCGYDKWQIWEDEKIKSDYPSKGTNIPELLDNGRTRKGIKTRARNLGIKYIPSTSWQSWECEKIKADYPSKGSNIPELLENGRSKVSIMQKASELGVKRNRQV